MTGNMLPAMAHTQLAYAPCPYMTTVITRERTQ